MHKNIKIVLAFILAIALTTPLNVHAEQTTNEKTVYEYDELKTAAADKTVSKIILGKDIPVKESILFLHDVTIDGNNHTLSMEYSSEWNGSYILKFHRVSNAVVSNVKFDGGNAAIQVNNSKLTLNGNITLGNQGFGGIELTQGKTAKPDPVELMTANAQIVNTTEERGKPTIWSHQVSEPLFSDDRFIDRDDLEEGKVHYYLTDPDVAKVKNETDLRNALTNKAHTIVLENDIEVANKINIDYKVTVDGNGFVLRGTDAEGWQGFYLLQFYKTEGVVKNITLTGADAGLYVNGSTVTLEGDIDVSGNEFGGIEVSQGSNVDLVPTLDATDATLINDTEDFGLPTIWNDNTEHKVLPESFVVRTDVKENQTQYYINKVTPTEKQVTDLVLEVLEKVEFEGFEIVVDKEARTVTLRKLTEGATLTEDDVVDALVLAILSQKDARSFTLDERTYHDYDEAIVEKAVRDFVQLVKNNDEEALDLFNNLKVVLNFGVAYDGTVVPTEDVDLTFTQTDKDKDPTEKEEPTDKEEPTEKPGDNTDGDKVDDKGKDKKDNGKKTPATGLSDLTTMYASLLVMGALVIVLTKLRKTRNI